MHYYQWHCDGIIIPLKKEEEEEMMMMMSFYKTPNSDSLVKRYMVKTT
jgi:hypothetical protein